MHRFLLPGILLLFIVPSKAAEIDPANRAALDQWIARQAKIRTLSAEFVQTRTLRALRSPVAPTGRMWFRAPGDFRWELGTPARTIVIRKGGTVSFIEPKKKRASLSAADEMARQTGMMDFPFIATPAEFDRRFEIISLERDGDLCRAALRAKEGPAREHLKALKLVFSVSTGHLATLEMAFRDGSSLRNDFSNVKINEKLPANMFDYDLDGFKVENAGR